MTKQEALKRRLQIKRFVRQIQPLIFAERERGSRNIQKLFAQRESGETIRIVLSDRWRGLS